MAKKKTTQKQKQATDLISSLEGFFKMAPHLPMNAREVLVKIAPWLALIFGILGVLGGISALGLSPLALFGGIKAGTFVFWTGILAIVSSVFMLMAYPGLLKHSSAGWNLLFWSEVVSAVSSLLSFSVGSVVGILIGFYLLFEIKGHYK